LSCVFRFQHPANSNNETFKIHRDGSVTCDRSSLSGVAAVAQCAGRNTPLRLVRSIDRGTHGWQEYVTAAGCDSEEAVARFYRRLGANLALRLCARGQRCSLRQHDRPVIGRNSASLDVRRSPRTTRRNITVGPSGPLPPRRSDGPCLRRNGTSGPNPTTHLNHLRQGERARGSTVSGEEHLL
jgi:hypothetical protein